MLQEGAKLKDKRNFYFKRFIIIFFLCALSFALLVDAQGNIFPIESQSNLPADPIAQSTPANYITSNNTIANLSDVELLGLKNGQLLLWNATAERWQNANTSQSISTLAKLTDVTFACVSNGDILHYNSVSGKWENTQLKMTVQQIIDAYTTMAYKSNWDGSIKALINNWGNTTSLANPQQPYSYLIYKSDNTN